MSGDRGVFGLSATSARNLLVASLVLNFLLVGIAIGVGVNVEEKRWRGASWFLTEQIVELAGEDRREAVESALAARREARQQRRALRNERFAAIADAIGGRPFEPDVLVAAMSIGRGASADHRVREHRSFAEAIAILTDDERAALSASFSTFLEERAAARR